MGQKSGHGVVQLLPQLQFSQDRNQGVGRSALLSGGSREESASKLIQIVGWIKFYRLADLRSLFPCWFSTGTRGSGHTKLLETAHILDSWPSSLSSKPTRTNWVLLTLPVSQTPPSASSLLLTPLLSSSFKGSCDHIRPTWVTQDNVPILRSVD